MKHIVVLFFIVLAVVSCGGSSNSNSNSNSEMPSVEPDTSSEDGNSDDSNQKITLSDIEFQDENLKQCVMNTASQKGWENTDQVVELVCRHMGITNLTGLEYFSELTLLNLNNNTRLAFTSLSEPNLVEDLTPLSNLQKLKSLHLWQNRITSITPLRNLPSLQVLNIDNNYVQDISPLQALETLEIVWANGNEIDDLRSLDKLKGLKELRVTHNVISQLSSEWPVTLEEIDLSGNKITELVFQSPLPHLKYLDVDNNQLKELPKLESVPALTFLSASNNQITSVDELRYVPELTSLHLDHNQIKDISSIGVLKKLKNLDLADNSIESIPKFSDLNELNRLLISNNRLGNGALPLRQALEPLKYLTQLNDLEMNAAGKSLLEQNEDDKASLSFLSALSKLETLDIGAMPAFFDLAPISRLKQLKSLNISYIRHQPSIDLNVLSQLPALNHLDIMDVAVDDASLLALVDLKASLTHLAIELKPESTLINVLPQLNNVVNLELRYFMREGVNTDLSILGEMPQLTTLFLTVPPYLAREQKADLSFLNQLEQLSSLDIEWMGVSDWAPIASQTQLSVLKIARMQPDTLLDPSVLHPLTKLQSLELFNLGLTDLLFLTDDHKTTLKTLEVSVNKVSDLSPLQGFNQLVFLDLFDNQVSDLTPLIQAPNLIQVDFDHNTLEADAIEQFKDNRQKVLIN